MAFLSLVALFSVTFGSQPNSPEMCTTPATPQMLLQHSRILGKDYRVDMQDFRFDANITTGPDYIIIGVGTAGSLLAERLSRHSSVLIIEQGESLPTHTCDRVPGACCTFDTLNEHQQHCDRSCREHLHGEIGEYRESRRLAFRKGVGGTSVLAVGVHSRGDLSLWQDLAAKHGGHWLLTEKRIEDLERNMSVQQSPVFDIDHLQFAKVTARVMEHLPASFADQPLVFPRYQDSLGYATNSYTQFLKHALGRPHVTLMKGAYVNRVISQSRAAPVVEVQTSFETKMVQARKEVLLTAGAIGSAALLQRSGVETLPLLDQPDIRMAWICPGCRYIHDFIEQLPVLLSGRLGGTPHHVLTLPGFDSGFFLELEGSPALILASTENSPSEYPRYEGSAGHTLLEVHIILLQPRKFDGLVSKDGEVTRALHLVDPQDIMAATAGVRLVRTVMNVLAAELSLGAEVFPGPRIETDAQISQMLELEGNVWSFQSATSTCRVGDVVDGALRVHGIEGMRVADASVLPHPPRGRTLFSTLMVAEIASDLLSNDRA